MEKKNVDIFIQTELIGNPDGEKFNDLEAYKRLADEEKPLTAVKIWSGDVIDCIEFVYNDGKTHRKGESPFFHGGENGWEKVFTIKKGDTLRKIRGVYDRYPESSDQDQRDKILIRQIQFETHSGAVSPMYGNECGKTLTPAAENFLLDVGKDNMICAVFGTSLREKLQLHGYINSIGGIFTEKPFIKSDLMGSGNSYGFDDLETYKNSGDKTLKGVRVWWGDVIDCIEAVYKEEKAYNKGESPFFHGGLKGDNYNYFPIDKEDALKKITCTYGSYPGTNDQPDLYVLIEIQFETRKGRKSGVYGHYEKYKVIKEQKEFVVEAGVGQEICAFYGYTLTNENLGLYNFMRALGCYFK